MTNSNFQTIKLQNSHKQQQVVETGVTHRSRQTETRDEEKKLQWSNRTLNCKILVAAVPCKSNSIPKQQQQQQLLLLLLLLFRFV